MSKKGFWRRLFHKSGPAADENLCPCCGKYRLDEIGKYEICPVCQWEDDPLQRKDPTFAGGANKLSLEEARAEYQKGENNK